MGDSRSSGQQNVSDGSVPDSEESLLTIEEKRRAFGVRLRSLREGLNQTERDIIHLTRISPPFITALEEGQFEALPGEVFGRGFIKNICKVLDTDPEALLKDYNQCWEGQLTKPKPSYHSRRLFSHRYRSEFRSRSSLPFTNYFSNRGLLLWIGGPAILIISLILTYTWKSADTFQANPEPVETKATGTAEPSEPQEIKAAVREAATTRSEEGGTESDNRSPETGHSEGPWGSADGIHPAELEETAGLGLVNTSDEKARLKISVLEDVEIRIRLDNSKAETRKFAKGSYNYRFDEKASLYIAEPSRARVWFNGNALDGGGEIPREQNLSFFNSREGTASL